MLLTVQEKCRSIQKASPSQNVSQKILSLRLLCLISYSCEKQRVNDKKVMIINLNWHIWDEECNQNFCQFEEKLTEYKYKKFPHLAKFPFTSVTPTTTSLCLKLRSSE